MTDRAAVLQLAKEVRANWVNPMYCEQPIYLVTYENLDRLAEAVIEMAAQLDLARRLLQDATVEVTPELTPYDQWHEEVARFLEATKK